MCLKAGMVRKVFGCGIFEAGCEPGCSSVCVESEQMCDPDHH
jgi:hypothetical protein